MATLYNLRWITKITISEVTKLDAAIRQLTTAIELYFNEKDELSIYTLTSAAYQIASDLLAVEGIRDSMYHTDAIKEEYRQEWITSLREYENFLKHADKDPNRVLSFNSELTESKILLAINYIGKIKEKDGFFSEEFKIYLGWQLINNPQFFKKNLLEEISRDTPNMKNLPQGLTKSIFFQEIKKILSAVNAKKII